MTHVNTAMLIKINKCDAKSGVLIAGQGRSVLNSDTCKYSNAN